MAIKHHPDKNRDDPHAEERFKEIAIAYQTLSDPELRRKYNEFGSKESAPEGGYVDPEEVFGAIFGGERFVPIIGHISLGKDMKTALQEADEAGPEGAVVQRDAKGREILTPEEKAKKDEKAKQVSAEVSAIGSIYANDGRTDTSESGCKGRAGTRARAESGAQAGHFHGVGDGPE